MGISRYPRPGQKISPELLAPVLDVPIPWRLLSQTESLDLMLSDLDETTWERLSPNVCSKLGAAVVREISSRIASLPDSILGQTLPIPEAGFELDEETLAALELEARTYNCLVSEGLLEAPDKLKELTVKDLLQIRSFGAKSLVDLLAAIESLDAAAEEAAATGAAPVESIEPRVSRYPRPGHRLAPLALQEILDAPLPVALRRRHDIEAERLSELDERVWESLDTQLIAKLGELVVHEVDHQLPSLPPNVLYMRLPLPEDGVGLQDLELERRTYNCLQREGLLDDPGRLFHLTIGELLKLRGIGGKCLVDFLTAVEHCHPPQIEEIELRPDGHRETVRIAEKMRTQIGSAFVGRDDPRLGAPLRVIDPKASQLAEVLEGIAEDRYSELQLRAMAPAMAELQARLERCLRKTLIGELEEVTTVGLSERDAEIVGYYLGWRGSGPLTLKQIGERFGLTRERVRQIGVEQAQKLETARPFAPALMSALDKIRGRLPLSELRLVELLGEDAKSLNLRALDQIGQLFGLGSMFDVTDIGRHSIATSPDVAGAVEPISKQARRQVDQWGLGTLDEVAAVICDETRFQVDRSLVEAVLECMNGIAWLSDDRCWFLIDDFQKNKLERQAAKVLSVVPKVAVDSLRDGLMRSFKRRELAPPRQVVTRFLAFRGFEVNGDMVSARQPLDPTETLSASEETMVDLLRQHGPQLPSDKFEELCLRHGVKKPTFLSRVEHSPVFVRTSVGTVGVRGEIQETRRVATTTVTEDPRTDGVIISTVLDDHAISRGAIPVPAPASAVVAGVVSLSLGDGTSLGHVTIEGGELTGIGPLLARRGGSAGDLLVVEIGPGHRRATAWLGPRVVS